MELSLETLEQYGSTAIMSYDEVWLTEEQLDMDVPVDQYDFLEYQTYFPETRPGDFTDISFVERYPRSIRVEMHHYLSDGRIDMDEAAAELSPHTDVDPRYELEHYVWDADRRIFVVDDHNHALAAWTAAYNDGLLNGETTLLHIDHHEDRAKPGSDRLPETPPTSMEQAERMIGAGLWINQFIEQALRWDIIDDVETWGIGPTGMGDPGPYDPDRMYELAADAETLILDVDLDVFPGLLDDIHNDRYTADEVFHAIADISQEAAVTTIATSPGYLHQEEAPYLLNLLAAHRKPRIRDRAMDALRDTTSHLKS